MFKYYYFILIICLIQNYIVFVNCYRFAINIYGKRCTAHLCKDNNSHTLCRQNLVASNCLHFKEMQYNKRYLLLGHNGIRNKIAATWKIANLNLLHWSKDLEMMASKFIKQCQLTPDVCDFIANPTLTVGQNMFVSSKPTTNQNNFEQTYTFVIREWYRELGPNIHSFNEYKQSDRNLARFTNMIWPQTEFIGCNGARMFHGFTVVCYYHPAAEPKNLTSFIQGVPCTQCSELRPTCSIAFHALCGLDFPNNFEDSIETIRPSPYIIILSFIFVMFLL